MSPCNWGFRITEYFFSVNQGVKKSKKGPKCIFLVLFQPPKSHLIPIITKTRTELKHCHTSIHSLVKFCHDFYCSCQEIKIRYVKNWLFTPLIKGPCFGSLLDNYDKKQVSLWKAKEKCGSPGSVFSQSKFSYSVSNLPEKWSILVENFLFGLLCKTPQASFSARVDE